MYLTGIADEASQDIKTQIEVTRQLGWNAIESRFINGKNIHDLSEDVFDEVCEKMYATTFPSPRQRSTVPFLG
jgi:hypothetical protein